MAARSLCGVSPVRTMARISGACSPASIISAEMPASGASRLRWMSLDSAFSGDTYTTRVTSCSRPSAPSRTSASMAARNAASVLPEPVGAAISACWPLPMAGQASSCAGVAPLGKAAENHAWTAGWNWGSGMGAPYIEAAGASIQYLETASTGWTRKPLPSRRLEQFRLVAHQVGRVAALQQGLQIAEHDGEPFDHVRGLRQQVLAIEAAHFGADVGITVAEWLEAQFDVHAARPVEAPFE